MNDDKEKPQEEKGKKSKDKKEPADTKKKKKNKKLTKAKIITMIFASVAALIAIVVIVVNIFIPVKYLASYCVSGNRAKAGILRVSFVDVGYGDCIIIELPDGKNMLIDAGNGEFSKNSRVLKELNRRDIDIIDYLICSSVNGEHCGGLSDVIRYKNVRNIFMPYCENRYITDEFCDFCEQSKKCKADIIYSEYKSGIKTNDYFFTFLSPSVKEYDDGEYAHLNEKPTRTNRNNASAVIWLEYSGTAFLFTSDVEKEILNSVMNSYEVDPENYPVNLKKCNIVQLAGHGNADSASALFYDYICPETAVLSVGENGYGSPSVQVISDVLNCGANLYRSDEYGNIIIEVNQNGYIVK